MKKITKLWLLSLGLAGCLVALNASASTGDTNTVSLTLNEWSNSCTIEDYAFWSKDASADAINLQEIDHDITCLFLENPAVTVSLSLANLSDGTNTIANSNFTFAVDAAGHTWSIADLSATANDFSTSRDIYSKAVNTLWSWASSLTLSWVIPAWTPSWEYTGALNLTITAS